MSRDPINDPSIFSDGNKRNPAYGATAVVPNDSADLAKPARALYVGVSGDISVDTWAGDQAVLFKNVPVGFFPVCVIRVYATNTTATNIVALT